MIAMDEKEKCCGCGACCQACPNGCITMTADEEGFLYPVVKQDKCIVCHICSKVCPIENAENYDLQTGAKPRAYGGYHKEDDIRYDSSSGGVFSLLAKEVLDNGGKVFGCLLDENMYAVHVGIKHMEELAKLRGSKYVQSRIGATYREVKASIQEGLQVLFVGTPCQAAGLYSFLGNKTYEKLLIVDFICHGVPSPKVFADYIGCEEKKQGSRILSYKFRNKDHAWSQTGLQFGTYFEFENGAALRRYPAFLDSYMNAFLADICLRPSCHACAFKRIPKLYADITMADFWGVDKVAPGWNDKKGTSLILVHTDHGKEFWDKVCGSFYYKEVDYERAIWRNQALIRSAARNPARDRFFKDYSEKGFIYVERRYLSAFAWVWYKAFDIGKSIIFRSGQFLKFAVVGCSNTVINLAVYYFCVFLGIHYLVSYTFGFLTSVYNAFYWNNKYVFKNKQETNLIKIFLKVSASYGISFLISIAFMGLMVEWLGISSVIAPLLKLIITIPLNFFLNKVWAFQDK